MAKQGMEGFYAGEVANRLVEAVRAGGGIWQLKDLADYRVVDRITSYNVCYTKLLRP